MELRVGVTLKLLISFFLTLFKNQVNTFIISYMFYRKRCGEQDRVVKEDYVSPHCSIYKQLWGCPPPHFRHCSCACPNPLCRCSRGSTSHSPQVSRNSSFSCRKCIWTLQEKDLSVAQQQLGSMTSGDRWETEAGVLEEGVIFYCHIKTEERFLGHLVRSIVVTCERDAEELMKSWHVVAGFNIGERGA